MANTNPQANPDQSAPKDDYQRMCDLADAGDFASLLQCLVDAPSDYPDLRAIPRLLQHAVEQASRRSPRKFCSDIHRQAMAFLTCVTLRLQVYAEYAMRKADRERELLRDQLPERGLVELLPHITQMTRLVQELAASWAATDRRWGLARKRKRRSGTNRLNQMFDDSPN